MELGDGCSGKKLRKVLEANLCRVNGRIERFGSKLLKRGDVVELAPNWKAALSAEKPSFQTHYEDEFLKIVEKPTGWVCDEASAKAAFGPGHHLVHRLDKDTTGLLLIAKGAAMRDRLMELFEKREIAKTYLAVVDGVPKSEGGIRESLFARKGSFQGQTIWGSSAQGLTAVTHWKKWAQGAQAALLLCEPLTGRTHQIRVHLAEMGHPILVDRQYASSFRCQVFVQRPLLHAWRLCFVHPMTQQRLEIQSPLPVDIRKALVEMSIEVGHLSELAAEKKQENRRNQNVSTGRC